MKPIFLAIGFLLYSSLAGKPLSSTLLHTLSMFRSSLNGPLQTHIMLLFLKLSASQVDSGIVVTPDRNQTVPFASDENTTYTCSVEGGRTAVWEVRGRQIIGQDQVRMFADSGFFVEGLGRGTSVIRITGEARRNATQSEPPELSLLCVAVKSLTGTPGRKYFIITYGELSPCMYS